MRKWLHRALKGASLTSALFVFQACYGTPPGPYEEIEQTETTELVGQQPPAEADEPVEAEADTETTPEQ